MSTRSVAAGVVRETRRVESQANHKRAGLYVGSGREPNTGDAAEPTNQSSTAQSARAGGVICVDDSADVAARA